VTASPSKPRELWIVGTGGHARVVLALALSAGERVMGFIEPKTGADAEPVTAPFTDGYAVLRGLDTLGDLESPRVAVAIGGNAHRRESTDEAVRFGGVPAALVHASAMVEPSASIAEGAQVCVGAIVNAGASIGRGALINSGAIVEHECEIGDYAHICPGAALAGRVTVGAGATVGLGARVIQGVSIGENAVVGAGAVVLRDVAPGATVVGVPARTVGGEHHATSARSIGANRGP
jgi:sugar O-acyltransferase (sialic acid O-acetyltransferase NeuD family)